jgi:hypothetical protein
MLFVNIAFLEAWGLRLIGIFPMRLLIILYRLLLLHGFLHYGAVSVGIELVGVPDETDDDETHTKQSHTEKNEFIPVGHGMRILLNR